MSGTKRVTDIEELQEMNNINRLEVIDQTGRAYVHYLDEKESVRYSLQDDNRTLKIFIDKYDIVKANRVTQNK